MRPSIGGLTVSVYPPKGDSVPTKVDPDADQGRLSRRVARAYACGVDAELEYPRLLPAVLVPEHAGAKRSTRDWIVDWLCFFIALLIGIGVFADAHDHSDLPDWFAALDGLVGVAACVSLWWRRRRPFGLALVLGLLSIVFSAVGGAAVVAMFTVAVHRPFRQAALVAGLAAVLQPLYLEIYPNNSGPYWVALLLSWLIIGVVLVWGMFVRARRQLVVSLRDRAERAEAEQQLRVEQARQAERARIAREMHDVLAHRISLLSLHAGALEFRPDAPPEEVGRAAGVIRASAHEALEDLRAVIGVLREGPGADGAPERPQPTLADLPALIEESRAAGMRLSFSSLLAADAVVPDGVGRNAYRIVQEGLTNARKHARGSAVDVAVGGEPGEGLEIEIRNRLPVGALAAAADIPGTGTGIVGLAERASLAGGRLEHGRTDAGDYRLWAWLPWPT
jgi:signal transduction histidine kinase